MPAPAIFAGGITRHGVYCSCRYCSRDVSAAFEDARKTVARLEAERDQRAAWQDAWRPSDPEL